MPSAVGNLFADLPRPQTGEVFADLLRLDLPPGPARGQVWIEHIVSSASPEPVLYDQPQDEWVVLLQGRARLWVAGVERVLGSGDYLFIPAHTPHRVLETSADPPCVWLAVHIERGGTSSRVLANGLKGSPRLA
ncbi:cupin domain-containing protein [uncultured Thiodictyon sp.]|uniref:cupin domain-containing protein n=1 Tax=uncultured Thiodictyon sp. TaxID=1846217 RepID=UPI0025E36B4F|nr:cupin domain-containing protein [uncultured Thiodictyon sp.]